LLSRRPYKEPFSVEKALSIIVAEKGRHFDPDLVDIFVASLVEVLTIKEMFAYE
jgi:putative two-component system response regulator